MAAAPKVATATVVDLGWVACVSRYMAQENKSAVNHMQLDIYNVGMLGKARDDRSNI